MAVRNNKNLILSISFFIIAVVSLVSGSSLSNIIISFIFISASAFFAGAAFARCSRNNSDVHELKTLEMELRRSTEMMQHIIDYIPQTTFWKDINSVYMGCNKAFSDKAGLESPEDIVGKTDFDLPWTKEESVSYREIDRRVMDTNIPELLISETQLRADGKLTYIETNKIPLHDENGNVSGILGTYEDVTEKKKMRELIIQNEKMLSVGGLAAGMAHEINNPLAGIIQTSEVLKTRLSDMQLPANMKAADDAGISLDALAEYMDMRSVPKMLNAIQDSGKRISDIVNNMLSFARKSDSSFSICDLNDIFERTLDLVKNDFDSIQGMDFKNIEIIKKYSSNLPAVACEGSKIQQVLLNIIKNAAQAMFTSETPFPKMVLKSGLNPDETMVCLEISNNGPDISLELQKRIFEPFFTTKPPGDGTGLGLSVSYFIITENHGGEIEVESNKDRGVNFIIRLPLHRKA